MCSDLNFQGYDLFSEPGEYLIYETLFFIISSYFNKMDINRVYYHPEEKGFLEFYNYHLEKYNKNGFLYILTDRSKLKVVLTFNGLLSWLDLREDIKKTVFNENITHPGQMVYLDHDGISLSMGDRIDNVYFDKDGILRYTYSSNNFRKFKSFPEFNRDRFNLNILLGSIPDHVSILTGRDSSVFTLGVLRERYHLRCNCGFSEGVKFGMKPQRFRVVLDYNRIEGEVQICPEQVLFIHSGLYIFLSPIKTVDIGPKYNPIIEYNCTIYLKQDIDVSYPDLHILESLESGRFNISGYKDFLSRYSVDSSSGNYLKEIRTRIIESMM